MWLNVAAAMGVEDLSAGCEWLRAEHAADAEQAADAARKEPGSARPLAENGSPE